MDPDTLFAFAHGIRMTLETLGLEFDGDTMLPILKRMDSIVGDPKCSFIQGSDSVTDWDDFRHMRELEKDLCTEYLRKIVEKNEQPE